MRPEESKIVICQGERPCLAVGLRKVEDVFFGVEPNEERDILVLASLAPKRFVANEGTHQSRSVSACQLEVVERARRSCRVEERQRYVAITIREFVAAGVFAIAFRHAGLPGSY